MDPNKWGPVTWKVMHGLVEHYTPELHSAYQGFFYSLAASLPCSKCRNNYVLKVVARPFPCVRSRGAVREWLVGVHNQVNKDLNKPVLSLRTAARKISQAPATRADVSRMLSFMAANLQNDPPPEYRVGVQILRRHLRDILGGVRLLSTPSARPCRSPRGRSRSRPGL